MPFDGPAIYKLKNVLSGTYLDEADGNTKVIHGWQGYPNKQNQEWIVRKVRGTQDQYVLQNRSTKRYIHVENKQQKEIRATGEHHEVTKFKIVPKVSEKEYAIKLTEGNLVLDLNNGSNRNDERIHLWGDGDQKQKKWHFEAVCGHDGEEF